MESGDSSHPVPDDLDVWLEVTGGQKKGRTFGAGNISDPRYVLTGESSSSRLEAAGPSSAEVHDLRSQLEDYQARLTEEQAMRIAMQESMVSMQERCERFEAQAREREEKAEAERTELRKMMQQMMGSRRDQSPPPHSQ